MPLDFSDYPFEELLNLIEPFINENLSKLPPVPFAERSKAVPKIKNITLFTLERSDKGVRLENHRSGKKTFLTEANFLEELNAIMAPNAYLEVRNKDSLIYLPALHIIEQALEISAAKIISSDIKALHTGIDRILAEYLLEKNQIENSIEIYGRLFKKPRLEKTQEKPISEPRKTPGCH